MVTKEEVEKAREWAVEAAMGGCDEASVAEDAAAADAAWLKYFEMKEAFENARSYSIITFGYN